MVLVVGLGLRFFCQMTGYAMYHEASHDEPPELSDDMFGFNNIVKPILDPEHWHQEALMRGITFLIGVLFFGLAISTPGVGSAVAQPSFSPTMTFWGRLYLAAHLLLDPVLGVAWRVANTDLKARV